MHLTQFKFLILSLLGFSMVVGIFNVANTFADVNDPTREYINIYQMPALSIRPGETRQMSILIKNTSIETWDQDVLKLGTTFHNGDLDRPSAWETEEWESATRIATDNIESVKPWQVAEFTFSITAPNRTGVYQEYFRPVLEHNRWLNGDPIVLTFRVGGLGDIIVAKGPAKEIQIHRGDQEADLITSGIVVATLPISSGAPGYTTPAGQYKIMNHYEKAYSEEYELWMPNWMALYNLETGFQGYGFHGLPYWNIKQPTTKYQEGNIYPGGRLYTQGRLYEGSSHLGTPVSHGCVRFGIEEVKFVYNWAEDGTPVNIL